MSNQRSRSWLAFFLAALGGLRAGEDEADDEARRDR